MIKIPAHITVWLNKLAFLKENAASASSLAQKYELQIQIKEALAHIKPALKALEENLIVKKDEKSYLQTQEAISSNPSLKFELKHKISSITSEISELENKIAEIKALVD